MRPLLRPLLFLFATCALVAHPAEPALTAEEIPSPAAPHSSGSSVVVAPDGTAWLTWLERTERETQLRFSTFNAAAKRWRPARTIARGPDWFVNWADFPALNVGPEGRATAVWFVNNPKPTSTATGVTHDHHGPGYRAWISHTADSGATWSAPAPLTAESGSVEFVSLATLADGRVLAAWLDGRAKKSRNRAAQQLFARIVHPASSTPDTLVDASVCDCCQTALTAFPDGTALLAYRGRTEEEVRDIRVTRFRGRDWDEPRPLNRDDWRLAACPVNGPQLASDGGRVAVAWFTAADTDPRVLASFSSDAGGRFLMPLRLSDPKPLGRVSTNLLHDGALLVSWVDAAGALVLRRVTPDYAPGVATALTRPEDGRIKGFPRLALLRDYAGEKTSAQLLATYTRDTNPTSVHTLLVTVPEGAFLEAAKDCDCAPTAAELQGYPIRGTLVAIDAARGVVRVKHAELPGLFPAGTREFLIAADLLSPAAEPGREFLGRFDRAAPGQWRLLQLRLIASAPR